MKLEDLENKRAKFTALVDAVSRNVTEYAFEPLYAFQCSHHTNTDIAIYFKITHDEFARWMNTSPVDNGLQHIIMQLHNKKFEISVIGDVVDIRKDIQHQRARIFLSHIEFISLKSV